MNYQLQLDQLIATWQRDGVRPHLLLHVCCAPCSSYCMEYLAKYCRLTVYYYNPNITIAEEYRHRADEVRRLIAEINNPEISFLEGSYQPKQWLEAVHGLEFEPEGGKRCEVCFRLRLEDAARKAEEIGADYFTTSLTISPLKNAVLINEIGSSLSGKWLPSDFKKRGGYLRSIELSRQFNLYRQNYCGCIYSRRDGAYIEN